MKVKLNSTGQDKKKKTVTFEIGAVTSS